MYTFQGVVPCVAVTVPLIGSVVDVVMYVCIGWFIICACTAFVMLTGIVGFCTVTGTVPTAVTGSVTDVVIYVEIDDGMLMLTCNWLSAFMIAWSWLLIVWSCCATSPACLFITAWSWLATFSNCCFSSVTAAVHPAKSNKKLIYIHQLHTPRNQME
jgi:hypothetical protein